MLYISDGVLFLKSIAYLPGVALVPVFFLLGRRTAGTASGITMATLATRLAARGTIRLALKTSGLDPKTVSPEELAVVVEQLLPRELEQRGVTDRDTVCKRILGALARLPAEPAAASPESVFARLGGED